MPDGKSNLVDRMHAELVGVDHTGDPHLP